MYFQSATGPLNFSFNPSARELRGIMSNRSSFKSENTSNTGLSVLTEADEREGKYSFELGRVGFCFVALYYTVRYDVLWCDVVWFDNTSHIIISHHITWTWHGIPGHYITCLAVPLYDWTTLHCRTCASTHSSDTTISSLQPYLIIPYYSFIYRDYR